MSSTSQRGWIGSILGAALVVLPALKLVFRVEAGAEMAAFCVFMLLFIALFVIGLLADSVWSSNAREPAELEYVTEEELPSKP